MNLATSTFWVLSFFTLWNLSSSKPMYCFDTSRLCTSFLAFKPNKNQTFSIIQSMFDALASDITADVTSGDIYVRKNCSCLTTTPHQYATNTTFTIRQNRSSVSDAVVSDYSGLAFPLNSTREARPGAVVSVQLLCGCSSGLWNYLMSYVMVNGDSVRSLSSRFGVSMDRIEGVNGISSPDNFTTGDLIYIPLDSVPGVPYEAKKTTPPAPSPTFTNINISAADQVNHTSKGGGHVPYIWIVGGLTVVLALLVICILVCICLRSSSCSSNDEDSGGGHSFQILRKSGFFCGSARYNCCRSGDFRQTNGETTQSHHQVVAIPKGIVDGVFEIEKPTVFTYEEIRVATDGFADSNLLGHGNCGSVYFGLLREQEVAVKRMTATKTKEFASEMKVLCKVHHSNLVELIGYAATSDELFVVYEYVQKGMLKNHLHDPQSKEAVIRTEALGTNNPERRPLASIYCKFLEFYTLHFFDATFIPKAFLSLLQMLAALKNSPDSMNMSSLKEFLDPNMMDLYPHDCLFKIAMLAKQCVDDDPILRPNMKQVVISLSQILLSSIEWEATLAGNSQVFSGLVQGR
ncbi:hypothetical protein YC2023_075730 [Brassica napus]